MVAEAIILLGAVGIAGLASGRFQRPQTTVIVRTTTPLSVEDRGERTAVTPTTAAPAEQSPTAAEPSATPLPLASATATREPATPAPAGTVSAVDAQPTASTTVMVDAPEIVAAATPAASPIPPQLTVSTPSLVFSTGETVKTFELRNGGEGPIIWDVQPQQAWILASPSGGTLGSATTVQVRLDRTLLGRGQHVGAIAISSSAGAAVITVVAQ
jgi:hypothetical protein